MIICNVDSKSKLHNSIDPTSDTDRHVSVTIDRIWINYWMHWMHITCNYKIIAVSLFCTLYKYL
jgi:hypothetical protein